MSVEAEPTAPTIYDVARAAGVSIASVSRVLNGRRNPSPEIRDRVPFVPGTGSAQLPETLELTAIAQAGSILL